MGLNYNLMMDAIKNKLLFCGTVVNNELVLCRKELATLSDYYLKAYQNNKIKDKIYIYSNKGAIAFINMNINLDNHDKIYQIDFYKFFYQLYLSLYEGLIDDRRTLITANMALTGTYDDICNLFNISEAKLKMFMKGHSEYDRIISLKKLCNYLDIKFPIIHKIILDEK